MGMEREGDMYGLNMRVGAGWLGKWRCVRDEEGLKE